MSARIVAPGAAAIIAFCLAASPARAQSSPSPFTYGTRYDLMGRVTGTLAPDPDGVGQLQYAAVRNTYDGAGRLTKVESGSLAVWQSESIAPSNWTGFSVFKIIDTTYDAQNRKTLETVKGWDGVATSATQYSYDIMGRLQCTAVRMNPAVFGTLPGACTLGPEGTFGPDRITKNIYNSNEQLHIIQKAVGTTFEENYATYSYSANGNRSSVTDARGYLATMAYDGLDRQARWYFPTPDSTGAASTTDYEEYAYDANSNRTSLRKRDGSTLSYGFDALDRMTSKVVPERTGLDASHTRDVYYGYDSFGHMTYARFDSTSGQGVTTGYNNFGEVTSSTVSLTGLSTALTFKFDLDGNRTRVTYGDGNFVEYDYDGQDRPDAVLRSGTTSMVGYLWGHHGKLAAITGGYITQYDYYPDGRLQTLTNTPIHPTFGAVYGFKYNPASQITEETRSNDLFAWTGATNSTQSYVANGLNEYTAVGGVTYGHDANGNLTSDGSTNYIYDVENRLVSAIGAKNATLRYDPMGRLYETSGGVAGLTRFVYDGDALVQEFDSAGNLIRRYTHGTASSDDPLVWFEGAGFADTQQRLLRSNHQGSIVAIGDAASANIVAVNSYDEYGAPGVSNQGRFQYTGQTWMPELGLYYYKARMYSPTLGRFMQTDPIGYSDGLNLYAYVGIDPIAMVDPTGTAEMPLTGDTNAADSLHSFGIEIDTPEFDIVAHGNLADGVLDMRGRVVSAGGWPINAGGLYRQAAGVKGMLKGFGYRRGQPIRLGACHISISYAAELAFAANATVYFSSGIVHYDRDANGVATQTPQLNDGTPTGWQSITPGKNGAMTYTNESGQRFSYSAKTGKITQEQPTTGSIIRKSACVDQKKCGK